jgi:hypothetical protein
MHFLRSIQLDASDLQVFEHAARPGEWAVPGSFALLVGTKSFGHASLVTVADIGPAALADVIEMIAAHVRRQCGAPTDNAARRAAEEEVGFTLEIAAHPVGTLIALQRELVGDDIEETYKTVSPPQGIDHSHMRLWTVVD